MRPRLLWLLARPALVLSLMVLSLAPLNAFAATTPGVTPATAQHGPHFSWKPNVHRQQSSAKAAAASNMTWHGGYIMPGTTQVYAIFWEPTGNVSASYNSLLERYFQDVGGSPLYRNNTQYIDTLRPFGLAEFPSNSVFAGAWADNSPYPESPLLDTDIHNEINKAILAISPPSGGIGGIVPKIGGLDTMFFVFTEAGQNLCFDSTHAQCTFNTICAYHSVFGSSFGGTIIYAAIPYAASFGCDLGGPYPNDRAADLTISQVSHEQMEAATDPLLDAWYDGNIEGEIGDKCAWTFGSRNSTGANVIWNGHGYYLQQEWDNQANGCVLSGP